ncbi:MAG: NTP transferase domain-containing protein [Candidatus Schekmanbacteria bacterium]|nr:NTP transferase domain-containing protein [Candidatus Schekmanbacteria bacterium]
MKIIIPMAGHSRRFKQAGYATPKPFILIDGEPMIKRVCQMFSPSDEFIFVCNKEHLTNQDYLKILESIVLKYHIAGIEPHEYGPTYSAMQAEPYVNPDEPVIINYCDFTVQWDYRQFLRKAELYEGALPVFRGFHPASFGDTYYAYVKANENMEMVELREKRSFTDNRKEEFASTGTYYFDAWKNFAHYARELLQTKDTVTCEYYSSLLFNPMVRDGKRVCLFEVEKFICWGTPEDLQEYLFWSDYFANNAGQIREMELIK